MGGRKATGVGQCESSESNESGEACLLSVIEKSGRKKEVGSECVSDIFLGRGKKGNKTERKVFGSVKGVGKGVSQ